MHKAMVWLHVMVIVIVVIGKSTADWDVSLRRQSLLYGLLEESQESRIASEKTLCAHRLGLLLNGIRNQDIWSLKMMDASGVPGAGFLWGNNYWMGSLTACRDLLTRAPFIVASTLARGLTEFPDSWPSFPVEFYMATFRHNSSLQVHVGLPNENLISVGLCLPDVCTTAEISSLLSNLTARKPLDMQHVYDVEMQLEHVRSLAEDHSWLAQPNFILATLVLLLLLTLMTAGTAYDTLIWQPKLRASKQDYLSNNNRAEKFVNNNNCEETFKLTPILSREENNCEISQGWLGGFLQCFSVYSNTGILLETRLGADSIAAVHGLRFITMAWILMAHTVFYMSDYADNKPYAFRLGEGFMVQVVSNSTLSTDTFFVLSGFLVSYLFFKGRQGKIAQVVTLGGQIKDFVLMVLKRFLRLTPAYMLALGILDVNMSWRSRSSVFHMTERADQLCSKYWWRNMLYINNLFNRDEMCMSWSWYLSNDMQFFAIGSFLLILSTSLMALSVSIMMVLLIGSSVLAGFISYQLDYVPTLDQQFGMLEALYDPPWVRIGPYIIGMITGYLVVRLKGQLKLTTSTLTASWIVGSSCNLVSLFGIYNRNITPLSAALYVAVSRSVWGIGIAWVVVACCTNNAGFINRVLTYPAWVPLSRLTYCAYLLNPLLVNSVYLSSEAAMHVGFLTLATLFLGFVGITYFSAYVVSLAVETPTILLVKLLTTPRPRRHR